MKCLLEGRNKSTNDSNSEYAMSLSVIKHILIRSIPTNKTTYLNTHTNERRQVTAWLSAQRLGLKI